MSKADAGLRAIFKAGLPGFDFTAIESGQTSSGIPDTNYCYRGIEGWIEYKACDHWRIEVRPAQIGWIERREEHGGQIFVAVRRIHRELWLFPGCAIRRLAAERLDKVPVFGRWNGGPAVWDWIAIGRILIGQ